METVENYRSYKYWWLMLIIGILSVFCGIWVFRNPIESYFALTTYFCIMFILFGINEIVHAFANPRYRNWGWGLATGIIDVNLDDAAVKVQNLVSQATPQLPAAVTQQGISVNSESTNILLFVALESDDSERYDALYLTN